MASRTHPTSRSIVIPGLGRAAPNQKGYYRITAGPLRDKLVHRAAWESIAGRPLPPGFQVHHMGPKTCWCGHNLVALPAALHPPGERRRDPYTGEFLTDREYERRYGSFDADV